MSELYTRKHKKAIGRFLLTCVRIHVILWSCTPPGKKRFEEKEPSGSVSSGYSPRSYAPWRTCIHKRKEAAVADTRNYREEARNLARADEGQIKILLFAFDVLDKAFQSTNAILEPLRRPAKPPEESDRG
jgi:hypothetical protein